jgi:hypothetical protein
MPTQMENSFVTKYNFECEVLLSCLEFLEEYHSKLLYEFRWFEFLHVTTIGGCTPFSRNFAHYRLRNV